MPSAADETNDSIGNHHLSHFLPAARRPDEGSGSSGKFALLITPVLQNRRLTAGLVLAAMLQIGLSAAGLPAWQCPFSAVFSTPCPACGMTAAAVLLLQGHWNSALQTHLFSPLLLAGTLAAGFAVLMPAPIHRRLICRMDVLERSTGVTTWICVSLGMSWIWRMAGGI